MNSIDFDSGCLHFFLTFRLSSLRIAYLLAALWSVSSSMMNIIAALLALAGSTWALLKAIQTIRALEKKLKTLEAKYGDTENQKRMNSKGMLQHVEGTLTFFFKALTRKLF